MPEAAWEARAHLQRAGELIDESHFHAMLLACAHCRQRFLSVFTETVDWADGEDPQHWALMPLTDEETEALVARGSEIAEADLVRLAPERRALCRDFPKGAPPRTYWTYGMHIEPHD